jgi:hypothetical protein
MKKILFTLLIGGLVLLTSCGHQTIKTKDEAVKFLESNNFYDEGAHVYGQTSGGKGITTGFGIKFSGGNAILDSGESLPYTVEEQEHSSYCGALGYVIKFCGSQRYAYGGCIECILCSGLGPDGNKTKNGPSLSVQGTYIKAHFSYISKGAITKK